MNNYRRPEVGNLERIPELLKEFNSWICWKEEPPRSAGSKAGKIPVNAAKPNGRVDGTSPENWFSFEDALKSFKKHKHLAGIGFSVSEADNLMCIDIDGCRDKQTGNMESWAMDLINKINSYTEISPSGTGVKIFIIGKLKDGRKSHFDFNGHTIESYAYVRFLAITGDRLEGTIEEIFDRQELIDSLIPIPKLTTSPKSAVPLIRSEDPIAAVVDLIPDDELIKKIQNSAQGKKFNALMSGERKDYAGYYAASGALCSILAFWTRCNEERMDRIFRTSALYEKFWWEARCYRGGVSRGEETIASCCALTSSGPMYDPSDFERNDSGNAKMFVALFGADLRYCIPQKLWLKWDGNIWQHVANEYVIRESQAVSKELQKRASEVPHEEAKSLWKWAYSSGDMSRIHAIEKLSRGHLVAPVEKLDNDPLLLACTNGIIDLRSGTIRKGEKEDWITRRISTAFNPNAKCPMFDKFLDEIMLGDRNMVEYLWRVIGYCLTGEVKERVFFLLHGVGRNGKTTLVEVLQALMGEYSWAASFSTFLRKQHVSTGASEDIAHLFGTRIVIASESDEERTLDSATIKTLTGSDMITARFVFKGLFQFRPTFKIFFVTNHVPAIKESSKALWDRLHKIPFDYRVDEEDVDKNLLEKLLSEQDGILAHAVRSAVTWQKMGLEPPSKVIKAGEELKDEMDTLGQALGELVRNAPGEKVAYGVLYDEYRNWLKMNGFAREIPTKPKFGKLMIERGYEKRPGHSNEMAWQGIRLIRNGEIIPDGDAWEDNV